MVVNVTPQSLPPPPDNDPVPFLEEAGWAPGPDRKVTENLALAGIGFTHRPARKESQYRLSYPDPHT